jgi:RHS repeat-associated protein
MTYDPEGHLETFQSVSLGVNSAYGYDGEGRRVKKTLGSTTVVYVYDAMGELAAEYGSAAASTGTQFLTADHLGSTRLVTGTGGVVVERHDYAPFGDEVAAQGCAQPIGSTLRSPRCDIAGYGAASGDELKFTGKERDGETGLDYFGARYFSGAQGRFTGPDPIYIMPQKVLDPQQWNMYAYVRNNPLRLVDPTGMYTTDCDAGDKNCHKQIDKFETARQKDLKSKNEATRKGAAAYGDRGVGGPVVHVVTGQQMQQTIGVTANGAVAPKMDNSEDPTHPSVDVYINSDLGGKDLERTIAHEGTHVGDDMAFIDSQSPSTLIFNAALNPTHGQTEFNAFTAGAAVKQYQYSNVQCGNGPCVFGPKDAATINQFLHNSPVYGPVFNLPVFDPRTWPQQ